MSKLLLLIIYAAFISLGLPDSLLGSAWPAINQSLQVSVSLAGIISMIVASGTIVSSFFSAKIISKFGTGRVTTVSVAMTALALIGNSLVPGFWWLCVFAIPLGLGAGAVDAALNNFVALHYKAKHMSWLHCFWGIGATAGPMIMAIFLASNNGWRYGYLVIAIIQLCLVLLLITALPLWEKIATRIDAVDVDEKPKQNMTVFLKSKIAKPVILAFFCYSAIEATVGLWGGTYLVRYIGLSVGKAAEWVAIFYLGITLGRFFSGFVTLRINNSMLIRLGEGLCLLGILILLLPLSNIFSMIGLACIGLGCAPIFPSMLHETPKRFGKTMSQHAMGIQMACAYTGATLMPPLLGLIATQTSFFVLPLFLLLLAILLIVSSEIVNQKMKKQAGDFLMR